MKKFWDFLKLTISDFGANDVFTKAAAISYYTIFSLPPTLLIILYTSTLFYNRAEVEAAIFNQIGQLAGKDSAEQLVYAVSNLGMFEGSIWAQIISIGVLIFTATTIFAVMQSALNAVFKVKAKPSDGWGILSLIKDRVLSFSLVLGVGFILVVSLALNAAVGLFGEYLAAKIPMISDLVLTVFSISLSLIITSLLFGLIFKFLPDAHLKWKEAIIGAFITAVLFAIGKLGIGYYIGNGDTANLYETAGAIMVMMLWVYYASVIFLFGAILTASYVKMYGSGKIKATDYAVKYQEKIKIIPPANETQEVKPEPKPSPTNTISNQKNNISMKNSEINIDALNELLTRNIDATKGYREAALAVTDANLKNWLNETANKREQFTNEMTREIKAIGGEPTDDSSILSTLHRVYIDWSSDIISRPNEHIIEECIRGEETAREDFEEVLKDEKLSPSLNALLNRELREIRDSIIRLRHLENVYDKIEG
jgi:membrane protein